MELTSNAFDAARELAAGETLGTVSCMHHTPGYGQFADGEERWREIYAKGFQGSEAQFQRLVADRRERALYAGERRAIVAELAVASGTPLAAHDDETPADARLAAKLGASICEFPLSMGAAPTAAQLGVGVVMARPTPGWTDPTGTASPPATCSPPAT